MAEQSGTKKRKRRGPYGRKQLLSMEESNENLPLQNPTADHTMRPLSPDQDIQISTTDYDSNAQDHVEVGLDEQAELLRQRWANLEQGSEDQYDLEIELSFERNSDDGEADDTSLRFEESDLDTNLDASNIFDDGVTETLEEECCEQGRPDDEYADLKPLYPGAKVTLGAFMLMLAIFTTKYNLVGDSIQQLLNMFAIVLPSEHTLCSTLHEFKSYFRKLRNPLVKHYYCPRCHGMVDKEAVSCVRDFCRAELSNKKPYFLEVPLHPQIQNLFSQEGFYQSLQSKFQRQNALYQDIYDGSLYKSYANDDTVPLSSPDNISFTMNTDGASVFKSSNVSVWPVYLAVNELPYKMRMKHENMILAGLWFGNEKPAMSTFLKPLLKSFQAFEQGLQISSPGRGEFVCRGFLMCCTADLPARCLLTNSVQFNGAFSCWKCTQKGTTATVGRGFCHVFPYDNNLPKGPSRTRSSVNHDAKKATANKQANKRKFMENGIKGFSWLSFFPKFNVIDGIAIDYMHGVLLGVQKLLIRLWFSAEFTGKPFNFREKVCIVDARLESLKPTTDITRLPRSIENHLKYWKASEFRSFLLYYGAVILHGVLDDDRFFHYLLFVNAIHTFLKNGSTNSEIDKAENMILNFCKSFSRLYDTCYMTLNVHQLVHLADSVRCLGPLYVSSCFPFEDKNGFVMKMIRGTQNIDSQIISGVSFVQKLPELKQRCVDKGSLVDSICHAIENPNTIVRGIKLSDEVYVLGAKHHREVTEDELEALTLFRGCCLLSHTFLCFNRLEFKGQYIYGHKYQRMTKRNNSALVYRKGNVTSFGLVQYFLELSEGQLDTSIVAMIEGLKCVNFRHDSHVLRVERTKTIEVVSLLDFIGNCMFLESEGNLFICLFPNKLECD